MGCVQSLLKADGDIEELYTLDKCVGEGVEGQVYLASDRATGQHVAIKLVERGEDLGLGPEKVRREIQLQARLNHVNIVELKQVLLTRKHLAIVMTYEGGGDLHAYAQKYKMNEEVARYFFRQIVEGLEYCHKNHVAHRDLKLGNFLLTTDKPMRVKLTDFGCARHWDTKQVPERKLGRFSTFAGTPAYMSPQVLQSAFYPTNTYNAVEADVWALGIVLCHLFFGARTPFWLEPNAFRNEGATMQARIEAMKKQNWSDSDDFLKANVDALSPELRDLLDKIFIADELKRITLQGIKQHPWYTAELPPFLQSALDEMAEEQALRDSLKRATVSIKANRHDTGVDGTGDFATIDLLVDLAQKHRKMPGGSEERVFCLDMAHMDLGPLSRASTVSTVDSRVVSPTSPDASAHHSSSNHHPRRADSTASGAGDASTGGAAKAAAGGVAAAGVINGSLYTAGLGLQRGNSAVAVAAIGEDDDDTATDYEGTQHSTLSYTNALERVAQTGDRSTHLSTSSHLAGEPLVDAPAQSAARFKKTLSLRRSASGLVIGSYVLERAEDSKAATDGGSGAKPSWLLADADRAADKHVRSIHNGAAFFRAAASKADSSMHGMITSTTCTSRTVHGGTEHAAALRGVNPKGGIFVHG